MIKQRNIKNKEQQRGIVLGVTLILLVLITLLAVSGMRAATMEERMAGNSRNSNIAFQMAETALRQAEGLLQAEPESILISEAITNSVGVIACVKTLNDVPFGDQATWNGAGVCDYAGSAYDAADGNPPQFIIEFLYASPMLDLNDPASRDCHYRVTARGYGADINSHETLQTTYKFPSCS